MKKISLKDLLAAVLVCSPVLAVSLPMVVWLIHTTSVKTGIFTIPAIVVLVLLCYSLTGMAYDYFKNLK